MKLQKAVEEESRFTFLGLVHVLIVGALAVTVLLLHYLGPDKEAVDLERALLNKRLDRIWRQSDILGEQTKALWDNSLFQVQSNIELYHLVARARTRIEGPSPEPSGGVDAARFAAVPVSPGDAEMEADWFAYAPDGLSEDSLPGADAQQEAPGAFGEDGVVDEQERGIEKFIAGLEVNGATANGAILDGKLVRVGQFVDPGGQLILVESSSSVLRFIDRGGNYHAKHF